MTPIRFRSLVLFLCFAVFPFMARAFVFVGKVTESDTDRPVGGVMIKGKYKKKIVAYSLSKDDGSYRIEIPDSVVANATVEFTAHGFEARIMPAVRLKASGAVALTPRTETLKEVVVRPVAVRSKGDTISFSVDAIRTVADRSIEDVIARLPGVSVNNGKIIYNGEPINRFYIEGLDALGGNYSTASQNIRAEDVSVIDLYENHEPKQVLKDRSLSKQAAFNIKLKSRSLLRPSGYISGGSGWRNEGSAWMGQGFVMLVSPGFQLYLEGAGNNFGLSVGNGGSYTSAILLPATGLLRLSSAGGINLPGQLFQRKRNAATSANIAVKTGKYGTLRATIGYGFSRIESSGSSLTVYPLSDGTNERRLSQTGHDVRRRQLVSMNVNYEHNAPKLYVQNNLDFGASFSRGLAGIVADLGKSAGQHLNANDFVINDYLDIVSRSGRRVWEGKMSVNFHNVPYNRLYAYDAVTNENIVDQSARALGFRLNAETELGWDVGRISSLGIALRLQEDYTKVNTVGHLGDDYELTGINIPRGNRLVIAAGPSYWINMHNLTLRVKIPLELLFQKYGSLADGDDYSNVSLNLAPTADLSIRLPKELKGNLNVGYSVSRSGIEEFITQPIATDYRSLLAPGTGIPSESSAWNVGTSWSWRKVTAGFFTSLSMNFLSMESRRMLSTDISDTDISTNYLNARNRTNRFNTVLSASQLVMGQRARLKLDLSYSISGSRMMRNGKSIPLHNSDVSAGLSFSAPLIDNHLVIKPSVLMSKTWQKSSDLFSNSFLSWQASVPMTALIFKGFDITVLPDFRSNPLTESKRMNVFILGAKARYSLKRWEFELHVNNITNRRSYAVENYSNLIYTSTRVPLNGIEALASVKFKF